MLQSYDYCRQTDISNFPIYFDYHDNILVSDDSPMFSFFDVLSSNNVQSLVSCFTDTFEQNKNEAFNILTSVPAACQHIDINASVLKFIARR